MKTERNDPCPCGSGRRYKRCCQWKDAAAEAATFPERRLFTTELREELDEECDQALQILEGGNGAKAEEIIDGLLKSDGHYHTVNYAKGICLVFRQQKEAAIPYFLKATESFPIFTEAYFNLAQCYLCCFNLPEAIDTYRTVIRLDGPEGELGKRAQERITDFTRMAEKDGTTLDEYLQANHLFDRAFQCAKEEKLLDAIDLFHQVIALNPKSVQAHGNLGLVYARLGKRAEALSNLDRALELDPDYELAKWNRLMVQKMKEGEPQNPRTAETDYYVEFGGKKGSFWRGMLDRITDSRT